MKTEIEIYSTEREGYSPLVRHGAWRIAVVNSCERLLENNLVRIERHLKTDEAFVLLYGGARLFVGERRESCDLELGKIYNVKLGAWHAVALEENSSVLIVENDDTSPENTEYLYF